jgi:Na+/H+ antiporter NhaC
MAYFSYAIFCYIGPILSIALAYSGVLVFWQKGKGRKKFSVKADVIAIKN